VTCQTPVTLNQTASASNHDSFHLWSRTVWVLALSCLLLFSDDVAAQKKTTPTKPRATKPKPVDELTNLREQYIKATNDYKASLEKLRASYERDVVKAEGRLALSQGLFAQGLISKKEVEAGELAVAVANDKVNEVKLRIVTADTQIAQTLLEAETEKQLAKTKVPKGGMVRTAAYIRYNGGAAWALGDAWKVQRFFLEAFKKPLPIAVFGQGAIHDRWRLDHRNSIDVSLHPDGPEGQALLNFLRINGIPFLAFRAAIPGTATGPHIHIGRPSHRY
jgi:hypothetical protein